MDSFYPIVVIIALTCLVLFLTFIGLMMRNDTTTTIYPPSTYACPDYWHSDSKGNCFKPVQKSFNDNSILLNTGKPKSSLLKDRNIAPYSTDGKSFNTKNPLWTSKGETTLCAQKSWAVSNNIIWDGISNYNMC